MFKIMLKKCGNPEEKACIKNFNDFKEKQRKETQEKSKQLLDTTLPEIEFVKKWKTYTGNSRKDKHIRKAVKKIVKDFSATELMVYTRALNLGLIDNL